MHGCPVIEPIKATLRELWLDENVIAKIPDNYFRDFSQLSTISLAGNNLTSLPNLFWIEKSLKNIVISNNQIQSLEAILGGGLYDELVYVDVSNNIISYLNISFLRNCPKLDRILINGNRLTSIGDYRAYLSIEALALDSNPWHCDLKLAWMIGLASSGLTCNSPECLAGELINNTSKN